MKLKLFKENYAVCNLSNNISSPICIDTNSFYYITKFKEDLSIICLKKSIPKDASTDGDWRLLEILKPINLYLVGIASKISKMLKDCNISIFEIEVEDKNYFLIKESDVDNACEILEYNGFRFI
ncbi:ACT domain-containing protein [Romboutsia lituseburensis]|uniref:ACT domain-containing protein n=1 Tax=Romboutsia lituseburensis TaxID=1537 RepID=UPI00215B62BA|nr:ACT domain-containing protein [Romboutsia lituseburensis]MCR8746364.1 ACT domain-containing protein [Romboutsia lituseburensis]